ncbi:putative CyP450 monooxygenase [Agrocybe pediades]|nr:putative CyP450 monooxygenase [Agrocybe pediades]
MFPDSASSLYALAILVVLVTYAWRRRSRNVLLPPGPPGYPIIGNVYDIPQGYAWQTYNEWAKTYGDIFRFEVFGQTTIILNSLKAAMELLDKRSSNSSDRPRLVMADELMGWEWDFAHMAYSDRWRRHRRVFHQYFQPRNLASYYPIQKKVTANLLSQLGRSPENFAAHIRQHVGSVVLNAAYGYEVQAENDFYIQLAHKAMQPLLSSVHAGHYLVDFLPFLKHVPSWFPGAGFKRRAEEWAVNTRALRDIPFNTAKQAIANGTSKQSFVSDNLDKINNDVTLASREAETEIVKNCAGIVYLAGSDTSAAVIRSWFLAMAHHPDIQRKAQAEVERVVGDSRLPDFEDRPAMPYVEAMLLEVMRWAVVTPLGVPHRMVKDDVYGGYRIPAGTTVTANVWAILHDEEIYPEPFKFDPERFLKDGKLVFDQPDPTTIGAFGFGRRICPGRYLASNSSWIAIVSILATYNISKAKDELGNTIEPLIEFTDGVVSHPRPFKVSITPRSENSKKLVEAATQEMSS